MYKCFLIFGGYACVSRIWAHNWALAEGSGKADSGFQGKTPQAWLSFFCQDALMKPWIWLWDFRDD
eukprot:scaffold31602_cov38-Prasinocladus_malaysianus.AAC.1